MADHDRDAEAKKAEEKHRSMMKSDSEIDPSTLKTYPGNCHCGKFRFQITLPEIEKVGECNCSICYMNGLRGLVWFPIEEGGLRKFKVVEGDEEELGVYSFANKYLKHKFCKECGTNLFARRASLMGVNALALQPMEEIEAIPLATSPNAEKKGAKFWPPYYKPEHGEPMKWTQDDQPLKEGRVEYQGHCHCGKVRYVMRYKPMSEWEPSDCNCSFCFKHGLNNIYPPSSAVQFHPSFADNTTKYIIIHEEVKGVFCKHCGTHVMVDPGPKLDRAVLNVRTIEDPDAPGEMLDHEKVKERCKLKKYDQRSKEPKYEGKRHTIVPGNGF